MKVTAILAATTAILAGSAQAQYARVINNCSFPAYLQSVPYNGGPSGKLTTLAAHGGLYVENYIAGGSTIKMGTQPALSAPLFFGYSQSTTPNDNYYDLNNRFGNPFSTQRVTQYASVAGCPGSDCAPNTPTCYGNATDMMVRACARPNNITTTLCAGS